MNNIDKEYTPGYSFSKTPVVVYIRVSTLDQNPENQELELRTYIASHNMELKDIYEDRTSGSKESRPALDRLMKDARLGKFKHVVFWKVDRLGRNAVHTQTIVNEWKRMGISFTISTLGIDTNTPSGEFIFGIFAQFAQMERALIVERTNVGINRIQKELEKKGYYITKDGKRITKLGRPKGSKDKKKRTRSGYYVYWDKKK